MKKTTLFISIILVFSLAGCDSFFSNSWGSPREFDPNNIDVNSRNINAWINRSVGNPGLAEAVAIKIRQNLANATGSEKAALVNGGIILAVEASGIANSMLNNALNPLKDLMDGMVNDDLSDDDLENILTDIMTNVQRDIISNDGRANANNLAHIINSSAGPGNTPMMNPDHIQNPADLAMATMLLTVAVFDMAGIDAGTAKFESMNDLTSQLSSNGAITYNAGSGDFSVTSDASAEVRALAASINLIGSGKLGDDFLTGIIGNMFSN